MRRGQANDDDDGEVPAVEARRKGRHVVAVYDEEEAEP